MALSYLVELVDAHPAWREIGRGLFVPWIGGSDSLFLAIGIVGATVMPHVIYLHSYLTQGRVVASGPQEKRAIMRWSHREVIDRAQPRRPRQHRHDGDGSERLSRRGA